MRTGLGSGAARSPIAPRPALTSAALALAMLCSLGTVSTASATAPVDTVPSSSTTTSTTNTTTTTVDPGAVPGPATVSGEVLPSRGTTVQLTPTLPAPPTTTTTIPPPSDQLPADSGDGRRAVYSKSLQRTWTVEADGTVSRTYLVSGRLTWNQPTPGTYFVFSRSSYTCNIKNPAICWRFMVRFTKGPDGDNIGFHEIPKIDGEPIQSESQLGTPLSGGCVRQATSDAIHMWDWAPIGTKVVVLP